MLISFFSMYIHWKNLLGGGRSLYIIGPPLPLSCGLIPCGEEVPIHYPPGGPRLPPNTPYSSPLPLHFLMPSPVV